jgi:hypothetical protein
MEAQAGLLILYNISNQINLLFVALFSEVGEPYTHVLTIVKNLTDILHENVSFFTSFP